MMPHRGTEIDGNEIGTVVIAETSSVKKETTRQAPHEQALADFCQSDTNLRHLLDFGEF